MVDGTYFIEVDTPLGRKTGTAVLVSHGEVLEAKVEAPIIGKQEATGSVNGNSFSASGAVKIPLKGELHYTIEGEVGDDEVVVAMLKTSKGDFTIFGARM